MKKHPVSSQKTAGVQVSTAEKLSTTVLPPVNPVHQEVNELPRKPDLKSLERIRNLAYPENSLQGVFWRDNSFDGNVCLTFDDGPNTEKTADSPSETVSESILNTLRKYQVKAVFFINGKNLEFTNDTEREKLKEILTRMINEGHLIGNHSYHHYNLAKGKFIDGENDLEETADEFQLTQSALDDLIGFHYPLILVRPPYAEPGRTVNLDRWLRQQRYYLISLQFDSYDYAYSDKGNWNRQTIPERVEKLLNENNSGGLLLLHELESTADMLPGLIQHVILDNGFGIESLDDILVKKNGRQS